jgi:hypothetical protein
VDDKEPQQYRPDAETAEKQVAEAHEIREDLRDRLVAIREDR